MSAGSFVGRTSRRVTGAGAKLLALENHFNPTLALSGTLRVGPAHAPSENPVLPSLTAEMLDKGTARRDKLTLADVLESRGASISFSASGGDPDTMDLSLACLSRDAGVVFDVFFEMLREPSFPAAELAREKDRLVGSIRQLDDQTGWRAAGAASRMLYPPEHPYHGSTAAEIIDAIGRTTVDDLKSFFGGRYGGGSLVLAAVGDIDAAATLDLFDARLSGWSGGAAVEEAFPKPLARPKGRELVPMKDKVNADVLLAHHGGLRRTDPDFLASAIGVAALGQSTLSSRLGLRVRDTEGLTYGINARLSAGRYAGPMTISLTVAPENLERAVESARNVTASYVRDGITDREIADEKRSRIGKFKVDLAGNAGIAGALDMAESYGLGVSYLDEFQGLVSRLTKDEINAAVRAHIRPGELVMAAAGDLRSNAPS